MNPSDNRFYRAAADGAASDRDLAEAIHHELISPESVEAAVMLWNERAHAMPPQQCMWFVLARTSANAIEAVLLRRLREAARTGPWDET